MPKPSSLRRVVKHLIHQDSVYGTLVSFSWGGIATSGLPGKLRVYRSNMKEPFVLHKIQLLLAAVYDVIDDVESWCKDHQGCKNDANTLNRAIRKHMSLLRCIVSSCRGAAVASLSEFFGSYNYKQKRCKRLQPVQAFRMLRIPACHEEKI